MRRFCRKCLLSEMQEDVYFENLKKYIDGLDEDLKVPAPVYETRLAACKDCEQLLSGMCRICGCYVELRAVMKKNGCPAVHPAWEPEPDTEEW